MAQKKTTFLASIGAGLEYYDFIVYGMMASYLSELFFPGGQSMLKTFSVFAVGYFARPVGGAFFGMLGDFLGRKKSFLAVMFIMAIATFSIGLLPKGSGFLLVFFRLLQGLSFGAELPGAITVVGENVEKEKQGRFLGFVVSSLSVGAMLASLVLFILTKSFTREEILGYAWRIPFFIGGILAFVSLWIRKNITETPEFIAQKERHKEFKAPLIALFRYYPIEILKGIGLTCCISSFVIFAVYLPTYKPGSTIYLANFIGLAWSAISVSICGFLIDKLGKRKASMFTLIAFISFSYPLFHLLDSGYVILFMIIYQTFISFLTPSCFALFSEIFPVSVRYTGIAVCYNITYSFMGCLPIALTYVKHPLIFLIGFAMISLLSLRQRKVCVLNPS